MTRGESEGELGIKCRMIPRLLEKEGTSEDHLVS